VSVSSQFSPDLPPIMGDSTHLQTLFLNLITNALDAMPGGGVLTIRTEQDLPALRSKDGRWLKISIADTGIGISDESKKKIFDPFFTTKKMGEGTGLGLAICEKIVKEHSGKMEVKSEVGRGSTFLISIPVFESKTNEDNTRASLGRG